MLQLQLSSLCKDDPYTHCTETGKMLTNVLYSAAARCYVSFGLRK